MTVRDPPLGGEAAGAVLAEGLAEAGVTTAATIGIGAAIGSAIPIPGLGSLIGAVVGAIAAGFHALADALKSRFHPYPVDASAALLVLAHIDPPGFFKAAPDAASDAHDFVRIIRYFRVRSGIVPKGYLGNTGELYDPVSSWARPWAGTDCGNPYLCAIDPHDPMTNEAHIAHLMAGGTHAVEIKHPIEARAVEDDPRAPQADRAVLPEATGGRAAARAARAPRCPAARRRARERSTSRRRLRQPHARLAAPWGFKRLGTVGLGAACCRRRPPPRGRGPGVGV
jgi:hypothetical protein